MTIPTLQFKKSERKKLKLKLMLTGPAGSGKTRSALRVATGMGGKIAVVDTENESASLYSDAFDFDTLPMNPPYTTAKYIAAIDAAVAAGYEILLIDSISHQWAGDGGILTRKSNLDVGGGNSYTNWAKFTPEQELFVSKMLHCPIHLIVTVRSKQDYVLVQNARGKMEPQKMGLAPIQRDGLEYEFTTVFDVGMSGHLAKVSKDRTEIFGAEEFLITEEAGQKLKTWLETESQKTKE